MTHEFTATVKVVPVVNDRPCQYPSGLTISKLLEVDLVDTGEFIPTIAGIAFANEVNLDAYLRKDVNLLNLKVQLGDKAPGGAYALLSANLVLD